MGKDMVGTYRFGVMVGSVSDGLKSILIKMRPSLQLSDMGDDEAKK
jgi:hypothetical protein